VDREPAIAAVGRENRQPAGAVQGCRVTTVSTDPSAHHKVTGDSQLPVSGQVGGVVR
jgi:hypothetical protein